MDVKVQVSGEKATLSLSGRFDFTAYKEFREYADRTVQNNEITGVEVDLSGKVPAERIACQLSGSGTAYS